jgi:hypothetical protein
MTDDGFNAGVLYLGERTPFQPVTGTSGIDLSALEKEFEI